MALIGNVYYLPLLGAGSGVLAIVIWGMGQSFSQVGAELDGQQQLGMMGLGWAHRAGNQLGSGGEGAPICTSPPSSRKGQPQQVPHPGWISALQHPSLPPQSRNDKTERPFRAEK